MTDTHTVDGVTETFETEEGNMQRDAVPECDLIAAAYVNLLRLPPASPHRLNLQTAMCLLRDELCSFENKDAEHIQTNFERVAEIIENQEPLGREFEKVLFDNLWNLYSR